MNERGERLSYRDSHGNEHEETEPDFQDTLDRMAAMDLAPPTGIDDIYTPNQLLARMLRDGEEGCRQTMDELRTLSDSREDRRTAAYYDVAIGMVDVIRKMAENDGRPSEWRHGLNEHLVQALSLEDE